MRRRALEAAALAAVLGLLAPGCSRFYPLEDAVDDAADADTAAPDAEGDLPGDAEPGDTGDDTGEGDTAPGDTAGDEGDTAPGDTGGEVDTAPGDTGGEVDTEPGDTAGDTAAVGPDIPCPAPCPGLGATRCATDGTAAVQTCAAEPTTGCLVWGDAAACPADDLCAGPPLCTDGSCGYDAAGAVTCPGGTPCAPSTCDPATGGCVDSVLPKNTPCDDGDPCTTAEICDEAGACKGLPDFIACSCDDDVDCIPFDEGDLCNGAFKCLAEVCVYDPEPVACGDNPDPCLVNVCDPADGQCKPAPGEDGVSCDDDDACSANSACVGGQCVGANFKVCEEGPCEVATCDPATGACEVEVLADCCGNGEPEGDEQCDPGTLAPDDACADDCTVAPCDAAALLFPGEACVLVDAPALLQGAQSLTIDLALRPVGTGETVVLLDRQGSPTFGDPDWQLRLDPSVDGPKLTWVEGKMGLVDQAVPGPALASGAWQRVSLVRVFGTPSGTVSWWVDGAPKGTIAVQNINPLEGSPELWIGCQGGVGAFYVGDMDELRISTVPRYAAAFTPPALPYFVDGDTAALYHFDNTRPGVAVDATGSGFDGLWQGVVFAGDNAFSGTSPEPASCAAPWCGRAALAFDPAAEPSARVDAPDALNGVQTFTVELFVRLNGFEADQVLVARDAGTAGLPDWRLGVAKTTGRVTWTEGQLGGIDNVLTSTASLSAGVWHHVAVVRRFESAASATVQFFIDGAPGALKTLSGALALSTAEPLFLGSRGGQAGFVDGTLDELRISAGALYDAAFALPAGLKGRWDTLGLYHFDVGAGAWAYADAPGALPPFRLEGVAWSADDPPTVPECPP